MVLKGKLRREGRWWAAELPVAGVHTQGRSRKDAAAMIADALESLLDRPGLRVKVEDLGPNADGDVVVAVEATEPWVLAAYVLKVQRELHGVSIAQAAAALGQSSKNGYARYEQGKSMPTIEKFVELLRAVAPELDVVITERSRGE